jgi:pimeloyl-ACP methyl ester carboxylesterase
VRSVDVNGMIIGCREQGDPGAPPILLLHGGGSSGATWDTLTPGLLAAGYRVIAPDLRGHGASGRGGRYPLDGFVDDLLGLLGALAVNDFTLVGHSLGGYVAVCLAQALPERVSRLVLEDPAVPPDTDAPAGFGVLRTAVFGVGLLLSGARKFDRRAVLSPIRQLRRPDPRFWAGLPRIVAPTLVLSGGPGSHISAERLRHLVEALPQAQLATVPVGHRIHSLAAADFAAAVLPFLGPAIPVA